MSNLLNETIEITKLAGAEIMKFFRSSFEVQDKSPDNPVTDADFAADKLLRTRLTALLPEAGWLSEETVDSPDRLEKSLLWVVDPLDGTKEFVMGIPEITVSVGLVKDGRPIMGVIYNPVTKELFHGEAGAGVFYNHEPITVTNRPKLNGATIDASRSEMKRGEFDPFVDDMNVRVMGSIAYKLARVSAGICDATWSRGPKHEWDICAGDFLVHESGGTCVDLNNDPPLYNKSHPKANGIIADNGHLHGEIVDLINQHGAARKEKGL
jgi:myo-inositol-1(or 4)-monophosphatase